MPHTRALYTGQREALAVSSEIPAAANSLLREFATTNPIAAPLLWYITKTFFTCIFASFHLGVFFFWPLCLFLYSRNTHTHTGRTHHPAAVVVPFSPNPGPLF